MSKYIVVVVVLAVAIIGLVAVVLLTNGDTGQPIPERDSNTQIESDRVNQEEETGVPAVDSATELLALLPHEITASGRTVLVDTETVASSTRDAYAALPYQVTVGETTQLVETEMALRQGEGPLDFTERFIAERLPEEDRLAAYGDDMYETSASVYELPEATAAEYPMADEVTPAEEGVSVFVRRMNFPDDSIGGREDRFDFMRSNGGWILVWLGERTYCRRPGNEFWQPADQLCP